MATHMKTTVELPDELFQQVKDAARREGTTMRDLLTEALRAEIARRSRPSTPTDFVFRTAGGDGLAPEIDAADLTRLAYGLPS